MVVGPRATKEEFLRDLGLNWDRLEDKPKYLRMRVGLPTFVGVSSI
jgi:hypothetical protein